MFGPHHEQDHHLLGNEDYDDATIGPDIFRRPRKKSANKVCRFCGRGGFHWVAQGGGWRLVGKEGIHRCSEWRPGRSYKSIGEHPDDEPDFPDPH